MQGERKQKEEVGEEKKLGKNGNEKVKERVDEAEEKEKENEEDDESEREKRKRNRRKR